MNNLFCITDFGAREGILCTGAIQSAFDAASQAGGTVLVPKGIYRTGSVNMGSASLYLEKGAVLLGSGDPKDYPPNGFVHNEMHDTTSLLYAMHARGITVCGEGTIDLNGSAFYDFEDRIIPEYYPEISGEQRRECTMTFAFRPSQPLFFYDCQDVTFRDVSIFNAPCWTLSFHDCENIRVTDVTIRNDRSIPNNDGIHLCSCRRAFIRGCNIEAGDDCVALSGITDWDKPCEEVVISDCIFRSTSKAIVLGYIHSIVRNVTISNVIIRDSQRGLCIMASTDTGLVENVTVSNLQAETRVRAGNWWGNGEPICIFSLFHHFASYLNSERARNWPVNICNIRLSNIICEGENVIGIVGTGANVRDITVDGLTFLRKPSKNAYLKGVNTVDVSPSTEKVCAPEDTPDYWLCAKGVQNVTFRHVSAEGLRAHAENCANLLIDVQS